MTGPPEFRDLVGDDVPAEERERLERVHELLLAAGPPPELPPSLAEAPDREARPPSWLPRRRLGAALALAAALALVTFVGGYLAGYSHNNFHSKRQVTMHGTAAAPSASGLIELGARDAGGNWPMLVTVEGLSRLPGRGYYELYLTRNGRSLPCGSFNAHAGATKVEFSVPYSLQGADGWVVTRQPPGMREPGQKVLTTATTVA